MVRHGCCVSLWVPNVPTRRISALGRLREATNASSLSVPNSAVRGRAGATRMRRRVVRIRSRPRRPECRRHRKRSNTQLSIASFTPSVFLHVATTAKQATREKMTRDCKNEACKVNTEQHTTKLIKANDAMIMISLTPLRH